MLWKSKVSNAPRLERSSSIWSFAKRSSRKRGMSTRASQSTELLPCVWIPMIPPVFELSRQLPLSPTLARPRVQTYRNQQDQSENYLLIQRVDTEQVDTVADEGNEEYANRR